MLLPGVVGVDVAHSGGDAALRHHGVRLAQERLGHYPDREPLLPCGDRRPQAGAAGADDQDVVLAHLVALVSSEATVRACFSLHHLTIYLPLPYMIVRSGMTPAAMSLKYTSANSNEPRLSQAQSGCLRLSLLMPSYALRLALPPLTHV